ncbi:MAG: hypothetical protein LBT06_20970 [Hungatella sp.]|jgi:hypothetical protein|nr:hypothetical protein [Hungatella sp.]
MGVIIVIGIVLLGYIFVLGCTLAVNPKQKELEDKEQMEWLKKYQETKK